jgi:hypothetical protein
MMVTYFSEIGIINRKWDVPEMSSQSVLNAWKYLVRSLCREKYMSYLLMMITIAEYTSAKTWIWVTGLAKYYQYKLK